MPKSIIPAVVLVAAIGWAVGAQPPRADAPRPAEKAEKGEPPVFELRTSDDAVLKVALLEPALVIATKYGKLTVPAADVRRVEFGFRYPDGVEDKVRRAVADLGAAEFRDREDAEQALTDIGRLALPALRRAARSDNPEVNRRAKSVIRQLELKLAPELLEVRDYDTVETAEFTIKGRLEMAAVKVRTKLFGEATLKVADIRSFRAAGSASAAEFALDAAKYAKLNQAEWMETVIEVTAGQQLEVTASGRVDQWPQTPGQYMCGPEGGAGNVLVFQPNVGVAPVARVGLPGQVIGRIGPNGAPFVVGASYKGKATESGKLYLRIGPSPWNCESSGSYKVTASVTTP